MATPKGMRAKSIGHYILGKTIGEGTFGKVKLGTHILTGEKVAVKILEKERIVDVADVERVAREIHILKLVQHPHVIQLYEIIETPRQLYLIMEYCSGGELFDHIVASGRVKEKEAARFFHQILAGVEQIHRMSVVHRDLKPENLLLDDQRNIKIVDFGLSNTFQEGQLLKTACGSPCYAAPEMIAGQRYVPSRCDIWSCGVILFALVCGYLPFEDQNTAQLYRKILNADYQAPKFISDSVRDLIQRMLTTDPEIRITVPKIRKHAWYQQVPEASLRSEGLMGERMLEEDLLEQLDRFGFPRDYAVKCLQMCKHNHVTTTYYLLLEKKRRATHRVQVPAGNFAMAEDLAGDGQMQPVPNSARGASPQELDVAECRSPDLQGDACGSPGGATRLQGLDVQQASTAADADRAAGASPAGREDSGGAGGAWVWDEGRRGPNGPNYGQWAQALGLSLPAPASARGGDGALPGEPPHTARGHPGGSGGSGPVPGSARGSAAAAAAARGDAARRSAASAEPPVAPHPRGGVVGHQPLSARAGPGDPGPRRHSDQNQATPRGPPSAVGGVQGAGVVGPGGVPVPRRRSPIQQATGFATPRGPVLTPPPLSQSATPSRAGGVPPMSSRGTSDGASSATPTAVGGYRARTPGKRPGTSGNGTPGAVTPGMDGPMSARDATRPGTSQSQNTALPSRPSGAATARAHNANDARRRHYTAAPSDGSSGSARGPPPSYAGPGSGSRADTAAAVAADLYGTSQGSPTSRAAPGMGMAPMPTSAWTARGSSSAAGRGHGGARASSASPDLAVGSIGDGGVSARGSQSHGQGGASASSGVNGGVGGPPLSARDARDEVMRTCRGAFNVSCTSSKTPRQIMQEIHRALNLQRIAYKQTSAFLVKCQKQGLRFEMEISHLDHLESIYVVRFRRVAGELPAYKELCSKILAEMKM